MKMPRSHCENENVQFIQELAEVDGPFESPININFRDLTKLELPSLEWNRSEIPPKKMKITNTGHTVIISGKWNCERPYLTGGPLLGKYVFSQIHFHWGQDNCKGSEHQVCGESFPLEMHVAHFKTDYLTQECALREKDGMVVVVYLFKLQEEPNCGLKKILNMLPNIKQASTSHAMDPRPILSLCNPFKDDYFMYWGSVVTPTCAHILLWIVCREPFGISKEQVGEFRKILDLSQQPISQNSRDPQPLHKRNVFHVNASKDLDNPLLPIKKIIGCFCKSNEDDIHVKLKANDCPCKVHVRNQEDIEGNQVSKCKGNLRTNFFMHHSIVVQTATVQSAPTLPKIFGSDFNQYYCSLKDLKETKSEENSNMNLFSQSCCFFPLKEVDITQTKLKKRKIRERKKFFNSRRALNYIINSLEIVKDHTFKKLKEIDHINKEIKSFRRDTEDNKWFRRLEKKFFESKTLSVGDNNRKMVLVKLKGFPDTALPCTKIYMKDRQNTLNFEKASLNSLKLRKSAKFSTEAKNILQSFFSNVKKSEGLEEKTQKCLQVQKTERFCDKEVGDTISVSKMTKGYITQKMFTLGNLEDHFFTEVTNEDVQVKKKVSKNKERNDELNVFAEKYLKREFFDIKEIVKADKISLMEREKNNDQLPNSKKREIIPLHKTNVTITFSPKKSTKCLENVTKTKNLFLSEENQVSHLLNNTESAFDTKKILKLFPEKNPKRHSLKISGITLRKKDSELSKNLMYPIIMPSFRYSSPDLTTDSLNTQRIITAKLHKKQLKKDIWKKKLSMFTTLSSRSLYEKTNCKKRKTKQINFENYYVKRKNLRKKNLQIGEKIKRLYSSDNESSKSEEIINSKLSNSKKKRLRKENFKVKSENISENTMDSTTECSSISLEKNNLKLECDKMKTNFLGKKKFFKENLYNDVTLNTLNKPLGIDRYQETIIQQTTKKSNEMEKKDLLALKNQEINFLEKEKKKPTKIHFLRTRINNKYKALSRTSTNRKFRASLLNLNSSYYEKHTIDNPQKTETANMIKNESVQALIQSSSVKTLKTKQKSLTDLMAATKHHFTETKKNVFEENLKKRGKSVRETFEMRKKLENIKYRDESPEIITIKDVNRELSKETFKKLDKKENQRVVNYKSETKEMDDLPKFPKFNIGLFITQSSQVNEKYLDRVQKVEDKNKKPEEKCSNKFFILDNDLQEINTPFQKLMAEDSEVSQRAESKKSSVESCLKGNADFPKLDNKELSISVSNSTIKKNPKSKPHLAETLNSLKKPCKRKSRKRSNSSKRSFRYHIGKNSSIIKKLNQVEGVQLHCLHLSEEEQLKIILMNVTKYLKEKIAEHRCQFDAGKSCHFKEIEQSTLKNLKATEKKTKKIQIEKINSEKDLEKKHDELSLNTVNEKLKKKIETSKLKYVKKITPSNKLLVEKKISSSKPVHNFIKINKLMAGKYKRSPAEKKTEKQIKKKDEPKKESSKLKLKILKKKNEKFFSPKIVEKPKVECNPPHAFCTSQQNINEIKNFKETKVKNPMIPKKNDKKTGKKLPDLTNDEIKNKISEINQVKNEEDSRNIPSSSSVLKKTYQSKKRWIPAFMLTTYLPPPIKIVENPQTQMNRYLVCMKNAKTRNYSTEAICEANIRKENKNYSLFAKDLEYLIKLQICLSNEITANIENSMNYVKTLLNQDYSGRAIIEKAPVNDSLDFYDHHNKGIVLIEMNNLLDCSSSRSDHAEDPEKYCFEEISTDDKTKLNLKTKENSSMEIPKELGNPGISNLAVMQEYASQDAYNSDSSYNCEISITLNASMKEDEEEMPICEPSNCLNGFFNHNNFDIKRNLNNSQSTILLREKSSSKSIFLKPHRKKRRENEISMEMKQKLLEILDEEIKREMTATYGISWENLTKDLPLKREDSNENNNSQSTKSSCDNMEVLFQISETMKQYLSDFKERSIDKKVDKLKNKESKIKDTL